MITIKLGEKNYHIDFISGRALRELEPAAKMYARIVSISNAAIRGEEIPEEKIRLEDDEFKALELLPLTAGDDVYILYGVDGMPLAFRVKAKLKEMLQGKGGRG